jgi:saccharopine dehydrogenase (NAD+, L-lysine-forming)
MSAQRFIDRIHGAGGRIASFHSLCGGLPAPSANDNPLGYKLSWSPRGVLLASRNTATYLHNGVVKSVGGSELYERGVGYSVEEVVDDKSRARVGKMQLEWYPNRDSTPYSDIYSIPEAHTIIRGTYRNTGWCAQMKVLTEFGFTDTDTDKANHTWRKVATSGGSGSSDNTHHLSLAQFTYSVMTGSSDVIPSELAESEQAMQQWVGQRVEKAFWTLPVQEQKVALDDVLKRMAYLGLFSSSASLTSSSSSSSPSSPSSPPTSSTPSIPPTSLDVLCVLFERHLQYRVMEEDMCVMQHTFDVEWPTRSPSVREQWKCVLVETGAVSGVQGVYSSMARTVSLPVAICIRAVLDGRWAGREELTGVLRPIQPLVYNTVLDEMEELGVVFYEDKAPTCVWVRSETKPGEHRVALTPLHARQLMESGVFSVVVERSPHRCIDDSEYAAVGCRMVRQDSWKDEAASSAIVLGLKELPEEDTALHHRHILFAHCYKQQQGWDGVLRRFVKERLGEVVNQQEGEGAGAGAGQTVNNNTKLTTTTRKGVGSGLLWDLEYLTDAQGRRVAAFGRAAGLVGMALGLLQWCARQPGGRPLTLPLQPWSSIQHMVDSVSAELKRVCGSGSGSGGVTPPSVLVLGAKGRCGAGCVWVCRQLSAGLISRLDEWDMAETQQGGPFPVLCQSVDVLVNSIYLSPLHPIPPFLTQDQLTQAQSNNTLKLQVVVDVSCDTSNPHHPLPFYTQGTTLMQPILPITVNNTSTNTTSTIDVIAIDHLPALIPTESSHDFSEALTPHLFALANLHGDQPHPSAYIWNKAEQLFLENVKTLPPQ